MDEKTKDKKYILLWTNGKEMEATRKFDNIDISELSQLLLLLEMMKVEILNKFSEFKEGYIISTDRGDF